MRLLYSAFNHYIRMEKIPSLLRSFILNDAIEIYNSTSWKNLQAGCKQVCLQAIMIDNVASALVVSGCWNKFRIRCQ